MADALETAGPELEQARAQIETTRAALLSLVDTGAVGSDELVKVAQTVARLDRLAVELERVEEKLSKLVAHRH